MTDHQPIKHARYCLDSALSGTSLLGLLLAVSPPSLSLELQPRIVGGVPSEEGEWPWMTAILHRDIPDPYRAQFCGGTLILPSWVMTAAHCVFEPLIGDLPPVLRPPESIDVLVGEIDLTAGGIRIPVARIIPHPDYVHSGEPEPNDLALLQLVTPAPQRPVLLPGLTFRAQFHHPVVPPGTMATALGWGTTSATSLDFPEALWEVELPIVDQAICQEAYSGVQDILETQVCAGYAEGGKDTCQGDSGGPLVAQSPPTGNKLVQAGITSFGASCAQPDVYGVYTRVSSFSDWITEQICPLWARPGAAVIEPRLDGSLACLDFAPVAGASGYRLYWAPYPEMYPVFQRDIGASTSVCETLPSGTRLWVAIATCNGNCLGDFSNIEPILVP